MHGTSPTMLHSRLVSPRPRYSPYGTRTEGASRVTWGRLQLTTQPLRPEVDEIRAQLASATVPLSACVEQAIQSV